MADQNLQSLTETTTPTPDALVYVVDNPNVSPSDRKVTLVNLLKGAGGRELLTADRIYYVRTDGSNSNTGLVNTAGGAFLTIQYAVDTIASRISLNGYDVSIQLGDGTYTENVVINSPWNGNGDVTIKGNNATPDNVIINSSTSAYCITVSNAARLIVQDLKFTGVTGTRALSGDSGAKISIANVTFGTYLAMFGSNFTTFTILSSYRIVAGSYLRHISLTDSTITSGNSVTCTITGTPSYNEFISLTNSSAYLTSLSYSGSTTGKRYSIINGSSAYVSAAAPYELSFPGSLKGTIDLSSILGGVDTVQVKTNTAAHPVTSSTTLQSINNMNATLKAGGTYLVEVELFTTSNVAGGVKAGLDGTLTATSIIYTGVTYSTGTSVTASRSSALATAVGAVTAVTEAHISIRGMITVNASGILRAMFAQNVSNGAASTVLLGSYMRITEIA